MQPMLDSLCVCVWDIPVFAWYWDGFSFQISNLIKHFRLLRFKCPKMFLRETISKILEVNGIILQAPLPCGTSMMATENSPWLNLATNINSRAIKIKRGMSIYFCEQITYIFSFWH